MYTLVFERENCINGDYEVVNLSDYGFEWFVNGDLVQYGLIDDLDKAISSLLEEDFTEVL